MTTLWEILLSLGISYSLAIVSFGAVFIGFIIGCLSVLFVSQRRSILGDTIAHSSLAGIAIGFLLVMQKIRTVLLLGALISSLLAIGLVILITNRTPLKDDVAIGISLSLFFSIGIALFTYIQQSSISSQAGLKQFIFGNITFLVRSDLLIILLLGLLTLLPLFIFWKEYKLILFDRDFAKNLGVPVFQLELLLMVMVTSAIVIGIEMIGIVLIAGMLIGPAVAARQWSDNYRNVILLAGIIGSISGILGAVTSAKIQNFPPGPGIIVYLTFIVFISVLFGFRNGVLINWLHMRFFHRKVDHKELLERFYTQTEGLLQKDGLRTLEFQPNEFPNLDSETVDVMTNCGYCKRLSGDKCTLTLKGIQVTQKLVKPRSVEE